MRLIEEDIVPNEVVLPLDATTYKDYKEDQLEREFCTGRVVYLVDWEEYGVIVSRPDFESGNTIVQLFEGNYSQRLGERQLRRNIYNDSNFYLTLEFYHQCRVEFINYYK